jgi:hypothetical protein
MNLRRVVDLELTFVKDKKGDLIVDLDIILNTQENCFSQLFSVYGISDVRQMELPLSVSN